MCSIIAGAKSEMCVASGAFWAIAMCDASIPIDANAIANKKIFNSVVIWQTVERGFMSIISEVFRLTGRLWLAEFQFMSAMRYIGTTIPPRPLNGLQPDAWHVAFGNHRPNGGDDCARRATRAVALHRRYLMLASRRERESGCASKQDDKPDSRFAA